MSGLSSTNATSKESQGCHLCMKCYEYASTCLGVCVLRKTSVCVACFAVFAMVRGRTLLLFKHLWAPRLVIFKSRLKRNIWHELRCIRNRNNVTAKISCGLGHGVWKFCQTHSSIYSHSPIHSACGSSNLKPKIMLLRIALFRMPYAVA